MAHFAKIENGIVTQVIAADNLIWCVENLGGEWIQTSYNTKGNKHPNDKPLNKNYAGIGYLWDGIGFYEPQPYLSWILNDDTYLWEAPIPYPNDGKNYIWNEPELKWDETISL